MLTVGSLFAGIGGLDLGLERAGMQIRWQVEIDPYCIRVLEKHWPNVKRYEDIRGIKWNEVEPVSLICGGFPCQPVSVAGARKGDKDDRWLWPEFLRAIREVRPKYALVENVPGLLSTDDGRLARRIFGDLAEIGYDAEWNIVSAADVGAPHLRKRVFIVGYPSGNGFSAPEESGGIIASSHNNSERQEQTCESERAGESSNSRIVAYPCKSGTRLEVSGNRGRERFAPFIFERAMVRQEYREIGSEGIVASRSMEKPDCTRLEEHGMCLSDISLRPSSPEPSCESEEGAVENSRCLVGQEGAEVEGILSRFCEEWNSRIESAGPSEAQSLADSEGRRSQTRSVKSGEAPHKRGLDAFGYGEDVPDTDEEGLEGRHPETRLTTSSGWWAIEPDVGRVADGVPSRVDRLKCLGNAVVPQVAEYIGKLIIEAEGVTSQ